MQKRPQPREAATLEFRGSGVLSLGFKVLGSGVWALGFRSLRFWVQEFKVLGSGVWGLRISEFGV